MFDMIACVFSDGHINSDEKITAGVFCDIVKVCWILNIW